MEQFKYMRLLIALGLIFLSCFASYFTRMSTTQTGPFKKNANNSVHLTLDDIFISVKTSKRFETTRLPIILKTWFQLAKRQTWFFTDAKSVKLQNETNGHVIATKCSSWHDRKGLNCKMEVEYKYYIKSGKKWFCHFDDDNYVNIFRLIRFLQKYDYTYYWYLGKRSKFRPVVVLRSRYFISKASKKKRIRLIISFATGGAGFCISKSLAKKMFPVAGFGGFRRLCHAVGTADDVCVGLIVQYVTLKDPVGLTNVEEFHSHIESLKSIPVRSIRNQISFSYRSKNILDIPEFKQNKDPSRFLSLHCMLYPYFGYCKNTMNKTFSKEKSLKSTMAAKL